ncbi:MAG: hypothetical protein QM778_31200 [Myxococcales bacterium]
MHTLAIIGTGLLVLAFAAGLGRIVGGHSGMMRALVAFLPLWFIGASINMYIGVKRAGYSVADEAPVFLVVFAVPAAIALALWWKWH